MIQSDSGKQLATVFGDDSATIYALNADTGKPIWKKRLDQHPAARITGAPVPYERRLYVPLSSLEELSAAAPGYECCKFRGGVAALDLRSGKLLWRTFTIEQEPRPYKKMENGTQLYGPAGGSVWVRADPRSQAPSVVCRDGKFIHRGPDQPYGFDSRSRHEHGRRPLGESIAHAKDNYVVGSRFTGHGREG